MESLDDMGVVPHHQISACGDCVKRLLALPPVGEKVVFRTPVRQGDHHIGNLACLINRPAHLRAHDVPMNRILIHDTEQVPADFYLQTHSTNPLLKPETAARAIQRFLADYPHHDSLFSVTRLQTRLYDKDGKAINHNPYELLQTQDLPPVYEENSCMYIFNRANLIAKQHRISDRGAIAPTSRPTNAGC